MADSITLYKHPEYDDLAEEWIVNRDFYEGKHKILTHEKYLVVHQLERAPNGGAMIRRIREQISGYTNFYSRVVSAYLSMMFRNSPDTTAAKAMMGEEIAKNVDGRGTSLEAFMRDCITKALIMYGRPIIRTDTYDIDAKSAGDEQKLGQRPIWSMINPIDAPDWEFNQTKLSKFRHEYREVPARGSLTEKPIEKLYTRIYSKNGESVEVTKLVADSESKSIDPKWKSAGPVVTLPVPEIPIAGAFNAENWVHDVVTEQRRHWNLSSDLDNAVHYQAYAIRVAKGVEDSQKTALSEYTVLFLPRDATLEQLPPVYPQALIERLDRCERNLFSLAFNFARSPSASSKEAEGADSIRQRKDDIVAFIQSQLEIVETVTNQALSHWAMMAKKNPATVTVSRKITTEDIDQLVTMFGAIRDELSSLPIWRKKVLKQLAAAQGFSDDKEVMAEIDASKGPARAESSQPKLLELMRGNRQKETGGGAGTTA